MNCKRNLILLLLSLFLGQPILAQKQKVDSLEQVLKHHSRNNTRKVDLMNEIAYTMFTNDGQKAMKYATESERLSDQLDYPKGKAVSIWIKGLTYLRRDKQMALKYLEQSLKIAEEIGDKKVICNVLIAKANVVKDLGGTPQSDEIYAKALKIAEDIHDDELLLKCLVNIARSYTGKGEYLKAIVAHEKSIDLAKKLDQLPILSKIYNNIAWVYRLQCNYPLALDYYFQSLKINEEIDDRSSMIANYINIAGIRSEQNDPKGALVSINKALKLSIQIGDTLRHSICLVNIGNIYQSMKDPRAIDYYKESLKILKGNNVNQSINALMNIGIIHTDRKEYGKALENLEEALSLAQKLQFKRAMGEVMDKIGIVYLRQKRFAQALDYCHRSLQIADELKLKDLKKSIYEQLSEIYAATGDYKRAYQSHLLFKNYNDSIFNENNVKKIADIESAYKYEKERQHYESEKQSNELKIKTQRVTILLLVISLCLFITLGYQFIRSSRLKKQLLQVELKKINAQLEENQKEMTSATLKLVQTAERDSRNIKALESIEKISTADARSEIKALISDYKFQSFNSNWDEFEILFQKVHTSFYDQLNEQFPTLTPNERKLCVFLKLNMTNKQIAQITFQSEDALKKARLRLRKKLDIDHDTNLVSFIQSI